MTFSKNEWVKKLKMITQACQRTCYATDGCVAFQYSLDDSRHSIICLSHLVLFYNIYSLCRDCKLLASPTSGKKIRGNYLTGLPKCPSGKTNPKCRVCMVSIHFLLFRVLWFWHRIQPWWVSGFSDSQWHKDHGGLSEKVPGWERVQTFHPSVQ